jgi:hypothetical protein
MVGYWITSEVTVIQPISLNFHCLLLPLDENGTGSGTLDLEMALSHEWKHECQGTPQSPDVCCGNGFWRF